MTSKISRSISMKLSTISRQRGVPYQNVLTEFLLERLLIRLLSSKGLSSNLVFKGGYVGRRAYGSPRYTVDLDALLRQNSVDAIEQKLVVAIESDVKDGAWYRFENKVDLQTQGEYPGIRFVFRAGLGEQLADLKRAQIVNFDIGLGDSVQPISTEIKSLLDGQVHSWAVYPREVMVAEKLHAFISRPLENSRSKDLFDLLFHLPSCRPETLKMAVTQTFEARGDRPPTNLLTEFRAVRTTNLKKGWASAVSGLNDVGPFEQAFEKVISYLEAILRG